VESLATEMELSLANASQHLQALKHAALVDGRKDGLFVRYRLADPDIFELSKVIRSVAERRLADFERVVLEHFRDRSDAQAVSMDQLLKLARSKRVVIVDTRPASEYAAGHIAGAISMPVDDLQRRLRELAKGKEYIASAGDRTASMPIARWRSCARAGGGRGGSPTAFPSGDRSDGATCAQQCARSRRRRWVSIASGAIWVTPLAR
jgi:hypothetical protein